MIHRHFACLLFPLLLLLLSLFLIFTTGLDYRWGNVRYYQLRDRLHSNIKESNVTKRVNINTMARKFMHFKFIWILPHLISHYIFIFIFFLNGSMDRKNAEIFRPCWRLRHLCHFISKSAHSLDIKRITTGDLTNLNYKNNSCFFFSIWMDECIKVGGVYW